MFVFICCCLTIFVAPENGSAVECWVLVRRPAGVFGGQQIQVQG